jgi:hypothetical protein
VLSSVLSLAQKRGKQVTVTAKNRSEPDTEIKWKPSTNYGIHNSNNNNNSNKNGKGRNDINQKFLKDDNKEKN